MRNVKLQKDMAQASIKVSKTGESFGNEECILPIDSITTTHFIGKERLTMHISDHQYYDVKYYEGIGSNAGLLTPLYNCMVGANRYLICYYETSMFNHLNTHAHYYLEYYK